MEKEISHVCPSKLSKRELQDLYYTVMQANVELKQTVNQLNDKMKTQGTKLQRILATQRAYMGTENRDCCATVKAVVQEQKHIIIDLKNNNANLKEQVRNLNMKLCSTKHFLKRGVAKERELPKHNCVGPVRLKQSSPRTDSAKNSSTSALHSKTSEQHPMGNKSVSCQHLDTLASNSGRKPKDASKKETVAMRIDERNKLCDQNKCRTQMEELQQKIENLQKELIKTHEEYANRIERLEKEVVDLHSENMLIRTEKALWEHNVAAMANEAGETKKKLADSEANREQLSAKLNIEKSKVAELQTQLKAGNMTNGALKAMEERFNDNTQIDDRRYPTASARYNPSGRPDSANRDYNNAVSQEYPGKSVGLNTYSKPEEYRDVQVRANHPNQSENKKCCENKKCPETLANYNLIKEPPSYSNPFALVNISDEPNTNRGPDNIRRCCNTSCPAKTRRQNRILQMKENSGERSGSNTSRRIYPNKTEAQRDNRQYTETSQNEIYVSSGENSSATRGDSGLSRYSNIDNRRDSVCSRKNDRFPERFGGNKNDSGSPETQRDTRQKITQNICNCIKEECEDVSSGDSGVGNQQGATTSRSNRPNSSENHQGNDNQRYNQRPLNKGENIISPDRSPSNYTTEYRSKYVDPRTGSTGFKPTLDSPNKAEATSPEMSELVNKSNESSCYCAGECHCVNTEKAMRGETAVSMFAPNQTTQQGQPLSTEEQTLLQKLMSLLLPSFVIASDVADNKPLAETSEPQSGADASTAKTADDSGFAEANKSGASDKEKDPTRANRDLMNKMAELQTQLDQLKVHVLSRRGTYTVLKDDATQQENAVVDLEKPNTPGGYYDQSDKINPYAAGPSQPKRTCESTCGKEGFNCTKECRFRKRPEDFNSSDAKNFFTRKHEENRYQIPGPLPVNRSNINPQSDPHSDVPINTRYRDSISVQRDHIKHSQTNVARMNNNDQQKYDNPNFYQRYKNKGFQENAPYIKEESPPTNRLQNIYMRDSPTNPALQENARLMRESPPENYPQNTYTRGPPTSLIQESIAQTNARYATETRENSQRPYTDRPQTLDNQNTREPANAQPDQYTGNPNVQNAKQSEIPQQPQDRADASKNLQKPLQISEHTKINGEEVARKCMCPTAKNTPLNCICGRLEYTTNVMHTCPIPKRLQYCETFQDQVPDTYRKSNADNVLSSNVPENDQDFQNKNFKAPNLDIAYAQNTNSTQLGTKEKPENVDMTHSLENKDDVEKASLQEMINKMKQSEDSERGKDEALKTKHPIIFEENSDRLNKGLVFASNTDGKTRQIEISQNQRMGNFKNDLNNDVKFDEQDKLSREIATFEANKIKREIQSNKSDRAPNQKDEVRGDVITDNDDFRKNVFDNGRQDTRFQEKGIRGDVNFADKISLASNRDKRSINRFANNSAGNEINDVEKMQQDNRRQNCFVDNLSENRFAETNTGVHVNNSNKAQINRRLENTAEIPRRNEEDGAVQMNQKNFNYTEASRPTPVATSSPYGPAPKTDEVTSNQLDLCEEYTHICTCPQVTRKDVAVFRSCSGTLRFRTVDTPSNIRKCDCPKPESKFTCGTQQSESNGDKGTDPLTYTINSSVNLVEVKNEKPNKFARATSPENTDQEISSMTDLPSERETATSPLKSAKLCPGTDRTTTTYTDSVAPPTSSTPMTTAYSLSDGEMPQYTAKSSHRSNSTYMNPEPNEPKRDRVEKSTSENVSKTLATISEELARCRQLLEKPRETTSVRLKDLKEDVEYTDMNTKTNDEESRAMNSKMNETTSEGTIALRRSEAKPHISNGPNTPHVLFTLHIGTIVLSDEAVINSRNMALVLTWKFYDQNAAMSHMRPGRVVHFDFSTEYDLKLSDDFLLYMKNEELQIKVCEVSKLDSPVASCSLPLREPLLHTNRRADMSLALIAGPRMQRASPAADALDTRDEMGVLDLWCMLRAEPRYVPVINKAISKARPSRISTSPNHNMAHSGLAPLVMQLDDDQSEVRLTTDLDTAYFKNQTNGRDQTKNNQNTFDRGFHADTTNIRQNNNHMNNYGYNIDPSHATNQNTSNRFTLGRRVSISQAPPDTLSIRSTATTTEFFNPVTSSKRFDDKTAFGEKDSRRTSSGFIINEVPTVIRSDEDMKQVVAARSSGKTDRKSMAPTLQDKYEQAQAHTKADPRFSYGQISISSLRDPRKTNISREQDLNKHGGLDTINRNWNKIDERDPSQKRYMDTETPMRERRASCNTVADSSSHDGKHREEICTLLKRNRKIVCRVGSGLSLAYSLKSKPHTGAKLAMEALRSVKTKQDGKHTFVPSELQESQEEEENKNEVRSRSVDITIIWLALNEECAAMNDPNVQRLYVAYNFLGRGGAELETPISLPKPKQYTDKCYFNFRTTFQLSDSDVLALSRLARCRSTARGMVSSKDCVVFTVVSEPVEDPLGLNNCEDIGTAQLFFGDLLVFSAGSDTYTEVIPIRDSRDTNTICGVLSIRVDGLDVVRKCISVTSDA